MICSKNWVKICFKLFRFVVYSYHLNYKRIKSPEVIFFLSKIKDIPNILDFHVDFIFAAFVD